jgi:hypothetical protein
MSDTLPIYIAVTTILLSLIYYIVVETLQHLDEKGLIQEEWKPFIEFLAFKPKVLKQKPSIFSVSGVKEIAETVKQESIQITNGIVAKIQPSPNVTPQTIPEQVLDALKTSITTPIVKSQDKPNMYLRKEYAQDPNPLDKLPYLVAAPFKSCEYVFDKSTDLVAETLKLFVIHPLRISSQVIHSISKPFKSI